MISVAGHEKRETNGLRDWRPAPVHRQREAALCRELGVTPLLARVLVARGLVDSGAARAFLDGGPADLCPPWRLPGMERAAARLAQAVRRGERVLVYGDYDADGVCSTALLVGFLRRLGAAVNYYVPDRAEGYGLHAGALAAAREEGYGLVVTVDCGITAVAEVSEARALGLDVVITDHHQPADELPPAVAVVNPLLREEPGPVLAGVGVAFKLAQATGELLDVEAGFAGVRAGDWLDLVALGTVADVVPLLGDNRLLVKAGLRLLEQAPRPGLAALLRVAGLEPPLTSEAIAFGLAPRLNAAGRMGSADPAVELLLEGSAQRAWDLARRLDRDNQARQAVEEQILREALQRVEGEVDLQREAAVVLASPLWHEGVVGIVAGRLAERLQRPVVLLALAGEEGKGSGRSVPGVDLFAALAGCRDVLRRFGGHRQAVGLALAADRVLELRRRLGEAVAAQGGGGGPAGLRLDAEVLLSELDPAAVREMAAALAPFGEGNPEPLLACRGVRLLEARPVGKTGEHLRFTVAADGQELSGIGFRCAALARQVDVGGRVDLAFQPRLSAWGGEERLELRLSDLRPALPATGPEPAGHDLAARAREEGLFLVAAPAELAYRARCLRSLLEPAGVRVWVAGPESAAAGVAVLAEKARRGSALLVSPGIAAALGRAGAGAQPSRDAWPGPAGRGTTLVDARGETVVPALTRLAERGRVVVPCPDQQAAAALAATLRRAGSGPVLYWDWTEPRAGLGKELLQHGQFRLALVPGLSGLDLPAGEWVAALAWPPSCLAELRDALHCGAAAVHLLYNRAAVANEGRRLAAVYPDRESLGRLYRFLRPLAGREVWLDGREVQRLYQRCGLRAEGPWGAGLAVLEELGLVRLWVRGERLGLAVEPPPPGKRNLEASWRFREGEEARRAWRALAERLLGPVEALAEGWEGVDWLVARGTEGAHPGHTRLSPAGHQL